MRMSQPSALASSRLPSEPGTRIMSPKQVKMTSGDFATAIPSSTRPIGITQTGQPGPCTSSTFSDGMGAVSRVGRMPGTAERDS